MNLATELELNENEVVGLMNETNVEEYIAKYLGIVDHNAFSEYIAKNAAHQIVFEVMEKQESYFDSLAQSFMLGFLMGHNFRERCSKLSS